MPVRDRARANWSTLAGALLALIRWFQAAVRGVNRLQELQYLFPWRFSLLSSMLPSPVTPATAPHVRQTGLASYPSRPDRCDHPMTDLYRYGNRHGRVKECRQCGARWSYEGRIHPATREEVLVPGEPILPRPRPGMTSAQAKHHAKAQAKASSAGSSTSQPSSAQPSRPAQSEEPSTSVFTDSEDWHQPPNYEIVTDSAENSDEDEDM